MLILPKLTSVVNILLELRLVIILVQYPDGDEGYVVRAVGLVVYGVEQRGCVLDNWVVAGVDHKGVFCLVLSVENDQVNPPLSTHYTSYYWAWVCSKET